jgi:hypothetical protein
MNAPLQEVKMVERDDYEGVHDFALGYQVGQVGDGH